MILDSQDGSRFAERGRRIWSAGFRPALRADYPVRIEPLSQPMRLALHKCVEAIERSRRGTTGAGSRE